MWRALFEQYRRLPRRMAMAYIRKLPGCVDIDDLEQWGLIGLMEAAKRFDPDRHVKFSTYASRRIHGAMVDGIREMDWASRLARKRGQVTCEMLSMETVMCEGDTRDASLLDTIDSHVPQPGFEMENADSVGHLLASLPRRWREIFTAYYVEDHTSADMAESLGLTQSRIFQILAECRRRLRVQIERQTA